MPVKDVNPLPGYYYHIYNRSVEGVLLFREKKNYRFFLNKLQRYLLPSVKILAYCLMPNHYHLLVKVITNDFSKAMQRFALSYVVSYNNLYDRRGRLFASPYQRIHIKDDSYLLVLSRYIHFNPIKAGLVNQPQDWEFSSYRIFIGDQASNFIQPAFILDLLSKDAKSSYQDQQSAYRDYIEEWLLIMDKGRSPFEGLRPYS